jgi:RNA polymerase sigma-70 factor (ECF subfamily)
MRTQAAMMVDTPIAEGEVSGTVTDKRTVFRQLADEHLDASYSLASAILRDPVEAQDVVHDAFVTAWRRWDTLRDPASFGWWFRRIVVNACRDRLRRVTRHPTTALPADPQIEADDPSSMVDDHAVLDRAFAVLSTDDKVVLILRYFLDLSTDDIARLTDIAPGTVGSRLNRARGRLREALATSQHVEAIS